MTLKPDRNRLVESLREAMDELCDPGLTLARADILRPRVARILEVLEGLDRRSDVLPESITTRLRGEG